MVVKFHDAPFDDATQVKLEIFRRYLQVWISIFMRLGVKQICIYDFFAGPGYDSEGNPGSPVMIVEEVKKACVHLKQNLIENNIYMVFNDVDKYYYSKLQENISSKTCSKKCCRVEFLNLSFEKALELKLPEIRNNKTANLIILDQFGVKHITPDIVRILADCEKTDILFFISSSFIRRFYSQPEIKKYFNVDENFLHKTSPKTIHRDICGYYKDQLKDIGYNMVPFSIKKGSNVYGVIFGSSHILGLDRFIDLCWNIDPQGGEANYNIDNTISYDENVLPSFEDGKISLFQKQLLEFIQSDKPDNHMLYKYCLLCGIAPRIMCPQLKQLQKEKEITVWDINKNQPARKNSFYLSYDNYRNKQPVVRYYRGETHGHK